MYNNVMIISPHSDDETIGCGGLIHRVLRTGGMVTVVEVCSLEDNRYLELHDALEVLSGDDYKCEVIDLGLEDGMLDTIPIRKLISMLDGLIASIQPDAVLFPYSSHHQDHKVVNQACIAALRPSVYTSHIKLKAMYEYPYLGSWGSTEVLPTGRVYLPLSNEDYLVKENALNRFQSQLVRSSNDILDCTSILASARMRGREIGTYAAEVYYPLALVL